MPTLFIPTPQQCHAERQRSISTIISETLRLAAQGDMIRDTMPTLWIPTPLRELTQGKASVSFSVREEQKR